ncbi:MAG: 3-isopropylmalate dehydratase large subunit, partial [Pseudomonadales bacterium]|nr:3-isopropylmalate dehydratase large subunit [Pseudomonadales bacterium]
MDKTLLDKIWDQHVVTNLAGGYQLLHIDRHLLHDLSGPGSLRAIQSRGLPVRNPELCFATPDHCVSSLPGRNDKTTDLGARLIPTLRERCAAEEITYFDLDSPDQGIVHVIGPELGLTLPGVTLVCGDSHTCTHGAFGALAWGIGSSELNHVLATQCVIEQKPKKLRVNFNGARNKGVSAKDMILYVIGNFGADLGSGHATEFAGDSIGSLSMEERMTLCNLSIEMGSKIGMIAPDDKTLEYLADRPFTPKGDRWRLAVNHWQSLKTDADAVFDKEVQIELGEVTPQVTWGISPEHSIGIDEVVPEPARAPDASTASAWRQAYEYMGLNPGQPIKDTPVDRVFIGSCTNSRLSDLEAAANVAKRGKVASGVTAWVVPGSMQVKREAEAMGLD